MVKGQLRRLLCVSRQVLLNPRVQPVVFTFVLVVLCALLVHSAFRKGGLWDPGRSNDFTAYHVAARAALDRDLHTAYSAPGRPYMYPPTLATLVLPLGLLPHRPALVLWVLGSLLLLVWSFRVLDTVLALPVRGIDKFFGFLLVYRMVESDFANTNANVLVLGVVVAAFVLERRGCPGWAGVLAALATSIKVAPLLLLPWMLYRRRWRMSGGFLGGLVLWGVLIPGTILGPSELSRSYGAWYGILLAPINPAAADYVREAPGGYLPGQSLRPLLHRLARPIDATAHDDGDVVSINIMSLRKATVDMVYTAAAALVFGGLLVFFRRRDRGSRWGGAEIAVAVLLLPLLSPLARKAHFVFLLPAATYGFMLARVASGARKWISWSSWWSALALVVLTSPAVLGDSLSALVLAFCPLSLAAILLLLVPLINGGAASGTSSHRRP